MYNPLFPVTVIDNFYTDPDYIRNIALNELKQNYRSAEGGNWPGIRSRLLDQIDSELYEYFCKSLFSVFYNPEVEFTWTVYSTFQLISPRHKDKYHPKNRGWVHNDGCLFGGLIYLTKDPEEDTGTSIYSVKNGINNYKEDLVAVKKRSYLGEDIEDSEFISAWEANQKNFYETIKIENVYNRCILFDGRTSHHAAQTFGSGNKQRLTQVFFCEELTTENNGYPLSKSHL